MTDLELATKLLIVREFNNVVQKTLDFAETTAVDLNLTEVLANIEVFYGRVINEHIQST